MELSFAGHRILPWEKSPFGQVLTLSPSDYAELKARIHTTGLPITIQDATSDQETTEEQASTPAKATKTPRKKTTEKAEDS